MKYETLIGKTFGKWKVVGYDKTRHKWTAICECGRWGKHTRSTLEQGISTQCMKCSGTMAQRKGLQKPQDCDSLKE